MKTSISIPDELLEEATRYAGADTRSEVIVIALKEFVRRRRVEELLRLEGRVEFVSEKERKEFRRGKRSAR